MLTVPFHKKYNERYLTYSTPRNTNGPSKKFIAQRLLYSHTALGLVFHFISSRSHQNELGLLFGTQFFNPTQQAEMSVIDSS